MDNATLTAIQAAQQKLHTQFTQFPGIHGTSIGLKSTGGTLTKTLAILVHLDHKRPETAIPAGELLPKSIDGFPVDVIEDPIPEPNEDNGKYRPLQGGVQIQVGAYYGTLGCMVREKGSNTLYALSNQHVMAGTGSTVSQPKSDPVCDKIGSTVKAVLSQRVDGAYCSLGDHGASGVSTIVEIGEVTGTYEVQLGNLPYNVRKRGRTTGLRHGRIISLYFQGKRNDGWVFTGQQYITSSDQGLNFSEPGDSGSAVVDDRGQVVGLLWGAAGSNGCASPIRDVMSELGIEVAVGVKTEAVPYRETFAGQLEAALRTTEFGSALWRTVRRTHARVRHQFHATPRLLVTWKQMPQQAIADALLDAARNLDTTIPETLGGEDTLDVVGTLREAMRRYFTDAELLAQVDALHTLIARNIGRPWREALADGHKTPVPA